MSLKRIAFATFVMAYLGALGVVGGTFAQDNRAGPRQLFSAPLADMPGKQLVVVELRFPPKQEGRSQPEGHRHPGSVLVYVTSGTARLGLEGEPAREVKAGETFFEPVGAVHTVGESASSTEGATAIAVMIVPDGAPLVTAK
jgi:quercetin dioxygenase-like cupin family protein